MKKIILLILVIFIYSCKVTKSATKDKIDRTVKEQTETITKRVGDTVTYEVPKIVYKDTTIVKRNYVTGTTQVLKYDANGDLNMAQCISGAVETITRSNKELIEAIKSKDKDKVEETDSTVFLYIVLGLVILFGFGFFLMYKLVDKRFNTIVEMIK